LPAVGLAAFGHFCPSRISSGSAVPFLNIQALFHSLNSICPNILCSDINVRKTEDRVQVVSVQNNGILGKAQSTT
jgi:hypothetical protein